MLVLSPARKARLWALFASPAVVAIATLTSTDTMTYGAGQVLVALWITMLGALLMRALDGKRLGASLAERLDVLTSTGAAMLSTGGAMILLARAIGWASLGVGGVLGVGVVYLAVIWTVLAAASDVRWRRVTIERTILPEHKVEGDLLREQLRIGDAPIAPGMRLFITGRAMPHGPVSRYCLDARAAGAEVRLESELGRAWRGEHHAAPLQLWMTDMFGLSRSTVIERADTSFTVLPRTIAVDGAAHLLGAGGDAAQTVPAHALPTEGSFRIREYVDGDDTRRIHWLRSLQQNRLVVRLPDEIPPADPAVRLILDNELADEDVRSCRAAAELLDALVSVWLGIAKSLADRGVRVTLVAGVGTGNAIKPVERAFIARAPRAQILALGARVRWQAALSIEALLAQRRGERQIVVSCHPRQLRQEVSWVVVTQASWTTPEQPSPREPATAYPYPAGSAENRPSRQAAALRDELARYEQRNVFSHLVCWQDWPRYAGHHVARRSDNRAVLEVIP